MSGARRRWRPTRRGFLIGSGVAGGALALGVAIGLPELRLLIADQFDGATAPGSFDSTPDLWFELAPDGAVRLFVPKVEMGQGIHTTLAQIAVEELALPWEQLEVVQASNLSGPGDPSGTFGSASTATVYAPLREAAATMREMLRHRAAARLDLPLERLSAREGRIESDDGRALDYAELLAGDEPWEVPDAPAPLTSRADFDTIGQSRPRLDIPGKVTGEARYGYDLRVPGMLYGAVARPPTLGARAAGLRNADAVARMDGVERVVEEGEFIGVVARSRLEAWAARDALEIDWHEGRRWEQAELEAIVEVGGRGGVTIQRDGDVGATLERGQVIEARYRTPFAVHAPLEPPAALAEPAGDRLRVQVSTQMQARTADRIAEVLGRDPSTIEVTPTYLGGGYGRKGISEVAAEAARLAVAVNAPVHVGWSRVEEMRHGYFRPPTAHRLRARLEGDRIAVIEHQQASGDVLFPFFPAVFRTVLGVDFAAWRGARIPYTAPHRRVVAWRRKLPVPTGPWRGLGLLANTFALESFIDTLAHAAGVDPLAFRLSHLPDDLEGRRIAATLERVAALADTAGPPPEGRARGLACCFDAGTVVAQIAEVSLDGDRPRVHRIWAAMDCGLVVNPDGARAQVEGNIMWGVGSALIEQMRIEAGRVALGNFDSYPLLTMAGAPEVEVALLDSPLDEPQGVGEPAIGPVAPAIANALFTLTGRRATRLPLGLESRGQGRSPQGGRSRGG